MGGFRMRARVVFCAALVGAVCCGSTEMYDGHRLLSIESLSKPVAEALREFAEAEAGAMGADFWDEPAPGKRLDVRVGPKVGAFEKTLQRMNVSYQVVSQNIRPALEAQMQRTVYKGGNPSEFTYDEYHTYDEIIQWIQDMSVAYPRLVTLETVGTSYEGRLMLGMKVTGNPVNPVPKEVIFTNYAIHSREWLSPATGVYMIGKLLEQYESNAEVQYLVDHIEWHFLPVTNPDGYVYTWTDDRMWRKTRKPNEGSTCVGTDPNRNWGYKFGGDGASNNPCSDSYHGTHAFSEVEVKALADFIESVKPRGYIDMHCCGAMWMTPWGYTHDLPDAADYRRQNASSALCVEAIKAVDNTRYAYGTIANVIYVASGSSVDYTYGQLGVLYSVAIELPGTFTSPPSFILPTAVESYAALKEFGFVVLNNPTHDLTK